MAVMAVVLAAGAGTRMKSNAPKILHDLAGLPLLQWVLDAIAPIPLDEVVVVVGHGAEEVEKILPVGVVPRLQDQQLGTGHALRAGLTGSQLAGQTVLVLPGDMPLLAGSTISELLAVHRESSAAATVLTAEIQPSDFGRILRNKAGDLVRIVEVRDADPDELAVREVNGGVYVFSGDLLGKALDELTTENAQGEYYLTDVIGLLAGAGHKVGTLVTDPVELTGVNSHQQLAVAAHLVRRRMNEEWLSEGVWMQDPDRVYIGARVRLSPGVRIYPDVHLEGTTAVGEDSILGPDVYALDTRIGVGSRVWYSVLRGSSVGDGAEVGPYASLRPGSVLEARSKLGTFVETKNTRLGEGAKVPHLAYMGDADIGAGANVGAGSITCNYDGVSKHHTKIGARAFIGSDTMLVAPVTIGDDAFTGAGSVITRDVSPGALAVERNEQKEIRDYAARVEARKKKKQKGE
ncbi:MAG: bifunctional UDP-N-acetylglucosamine diphosphorylase/glucosamine-1-phosphate N-acetyltransferase GlmU [Acidimicrobiia bacterium]|nr:bifunctional UDP-N-acetylglucosamine diphosphorylase/glucosamine-1-phosphate N-acetyltransferase GlmU [Acidimicrobiia bacterium]MDH3397039.1 bifunctional UDP-N-acetylglucosamine diphosphorylase/glucosamine-1-phosphate N-acetyltransferase GlmU [Acidimicrobiia bacterium]